MREWDGDQVGTAEEKAGFAELLRGLKDRSGLSYGTLAKRLHMSASTLHRYCNGDAVPADYAPVERLARLCKATPDELVEVHRRWVVAGAARDRERRAAAAAAGTAQSDGTAAPGRETPNAPADGLPRPGARAGAAGATGSAAPAGSARDAGTAQDAGSGGATSPTAPGDDAAPTDECGTADPDSAGPLRPRPHPASRARSRTRRFGRKAVLGASAAALALAATAALVSLVPDGQWGERRSGSASAADSAAGGTAAEDKNGTSPSPSPSVSSSDGGASPSAPARGRPKPDESGDPSPGGNPGRNAARGQTGAAPLAVTARAHAWEHPCSARYLINRPPEKVSPPPAVQEAPGWVNALGAVAADEHRVELTVQGTGEKTVVLQALRVRVVERAGVPAWNAYRMGIGCGGDVPTRTFAVDLAAGNPAPVPKAGQRDFPYKVSESDPEVLYVTAEADSQYVSWYAELEWSSGGRHGILRIDDNGKPFRTTSAKGRPDYGYPLGGDGWITPLDD
ncbi:helix-turn-helix transcriptional regulator [Streptomyces sp. MNU89]|uniref:helix-turn-helix domain-containing protein n=1 Tax=Streptomyces sp. MNU89 TaxID=2560025 RepID=UPI001E2CDA5D|nr:helix-turn-helix transcriptional regulator [Streptomyces sp. MNU89]MCC9740947.1 helix-turn-helix domain-containing protein [Streptomyces sp. MNU89]